MDLAALLLGGIQTVGDIINPGAAQDKRDLERERLETQQAQLAAASKAADAKTQQTLYIAIGAGVVAIAAIAFLAMKK